MPRPATVPTVPSLEITLAITELAGLGDGVGRWDGRAVFVPYTLPGDLVRARLTATGRDFCRAEVLEWIERSPERQAAPCPHFTECGGCSLQHLTEETYAAHQRRALESMLARLGGDPAVLRPNIHAGAGARRRAELRIRVEKGLVKLGFTAARSHRLIEIETCPVSVEPLAASLAPLRGMLQGMKHPAVLTGLHLTHLPEGMDMVFSQARSLAAQDRRTLIEFAARPGILRVSLEQDGHAQRLAGGPVTVAFGGYSVELPPGAFLQATALGQQAITEFILRHLPDETRVIDLFSGCGTYGFPLLSAQSARRLHAYEGAADMVATMHNAFRRHGLESRATASGRDLHREPVTVAELNGYDAAVVNPPRNGALPQCLTLAASRLPKILMISCNPATFERDARVLLQAGYRLTEMLPIDQFHWTPHMELASCFHRS